MTTLTVNLDLKNKKTTIAELTAIIILLGGVAPSATPSKEAKAPTGKGKGGKAPKETEETEEEEPNFDEAEETEEETEEEEETSEDGEEEGDDYGAEEEEEEKPAKTTKAAPASSAKTVKDILAACKAKDAELMKKLKNAEKVKAKITALLKKHGAKSARELDSKKYGAFLKDLKAL